mgnify:CR=1 FL=1
MRQLALPPGWDPAEGALTLRGKEAKRLVAVLRLGPGDSFPALAADGSRYLATVAAAAPGLVELRLRPAEAAGPVAPSGPLADVRGGARRAADVDARSPADASAPAAAWAASLPRIILAVGILKGSKLDDVVRAAAEAGVSSIVPLASERAVPRGEFAGRLSRLARVLAEATGQSGSSTATALSEPLSVAEFVARYPASAPDGRAEGPGTGRLGLAFHEAPLAEASLHRYCSRAPDEIAACVGPEGGFSPAELAAFAGGGYRLAWLGPSVLRAETAAVFALASIRALCLERHEWTAIKYGA